MNRLVRTRMPGGVGGPRRNPGPIPIAAQFLFRQTDVLPGHAARLNRWNLSAAIMHCGDVIRLQQIFEDWRRLPRPFVQPLHFVSSFAA